MTEYIDRVKLLDALYAADAITMRGMKILRDFPQAHGNCPDCKRCSDNCKSGTRCPIEEHYALPLDGYCHLFEPMECKMADKCYINLEDAIKAIHNEWDEVCNYDGSGTAIADDTESAICHVPAADVVDVVRCKDCKYRYDDDFCGGRGWPEQLVPDDGYCNNGAIKDGGV